MTLSYRIGTGYDVHRLVTGRPLVLGGVTIEADFGLEGHSDADVLSHAIADAVLGAAGLPDIGYYFPPGEAATAGMDSQQIIRRAVEEVGGKGYKVGNVDATLIAERPRILPFLEEMKGKLAESLGVGGDQIGIKATTHETLGAFGRGEGMAAQAVCLLLAE